MSIFILGETIVLQITVWFSVNNLGYVNCTIFSWWLLILVRYLSCNNISNISNVYMTLKCSDFDISVIFINTISLHFFFKQTWCLLYIQIEHWWFICFTFTCKSNLGLQVWYQDIFLTPHKSEASVNFGYVPIPLLFPAMLKVKD